MASGSQAASGRAICFERISNDNPRRRRPDISLASSVLGWEPKCELESGLNKTIAYLKELM